MAIGSALDEAGYDMMQGAMSLDPDWVPRLTTGFGHEEL